MDLKKIIIGCILLLLVVCSFCRSTSINIISKVSVYNTPILALKESNKVASIKLTKFANKPCYIKSISFILSSTDGLNDISDIAFINNNKRISVKRDCLVGKKTKIAVSPVDWEIRDTTTINIDIKLFNKVNLLNKISLSNITIKTDRGNIVCHDYNKKYLRFGIALRKEMQDKVNTSRIPGITKTKKGSLIAIYDARYESDRDLQGDIDICYNKSTDGGKTWSPIKKAIDMGKWGNLPEKYNGVSDGCVLSDDNTGKIYIIGLWMHGVLDPKNGKWIEGLTDSSTVWNHQWRSFGSQPGYDVHQSSQFLIVESSDDGETWSPPKNITKMVKPESWWLMAPAPGHGITLNNGTLVFPAEGRTENGLQISTIIYSKDNGKTWKSGNPAYTNTNECMAVELSDGEIMLNMRERSNRGKEINNGRAIAVTKDMGNTWTEHKTSRNALIESACQASIHKHIYTNSKGEKKEIIFFFNPSSKYKRDNFTLKCSLDNGNTWPEKLWITLDQDGGNGYSCITSIDNDTICILYEGSGTNLVFQKIKISDILEKR